LHGKTGEDGTICSLLEFLGIPFVGSSAGVCRMAWNKSVLPHAVLAYLNANTTTSSYTSMLARIGLINAINLPTDGFKEMGLATALDLVDSPANKRLSCGYPLVVKPARGGSAMGIARVDNKEQLAIALLDALSFDNEVLLEPWINGVELAVTVLGSGSNAYALAPVEIAPKQGFFNTDARLDSELVDYYCPPRPASLPATALDAIKLAAVSVHRAFGCRDLSRVDMIWGHKANAKQDTNMSDAKAYVLEINTSPGMTEHSLVPMACKAEDINLATLLERLLKEAIARA
jgi:D-alanine-D-alanine ligase